MTTLLQQAIDLHKDDACYGTVPGAIFNELQREWQIQKRRADELQVVVTTSTHRSYLPQLVKCRKDAARQGLVLATLCDMVLGEGATDRSDMALIRAVRKLLEDKPQ